MFCTLVATTISTPIVQKYQDSYHQYEPKEDLNAASQYDYSYSVHSEKTGDIKAHKESRDHEGAVKGIYMFVEPDGHKRTVQYSVYKDSGFIADIHREEVPGYKAPLVKYVKYEEPKRIKLAPVVTKEPLKFLAPVVTKESPKFLIKYEDTPKTVLKKIVQPQQLDVQHYERHFLPHAPEPVRIKQHEYQEPKQIVEKPIHFTVSPKQDEEYLNYQTIPEFLQKQQLPKYDNVYKQQVIVTPKYEENTSNYEQFKHIESSKYDSVFKQQAIVPQKHEESTQKYEQFKHVELSPDYKYEQYQIPSEYQPSQNFYTETPSPVEHTTQYEQDHESYKSKTAPQQFYSNGYEIHEKPELYQYKVEMHDHRTTTEHPEVETVKYVTPKYEVKYDHLEIKKEDTPQYEVKYIFVKKPSEQKVTKYEKPETSTPKYEHKDLKKGINVAGPVKQYRFSPLEDLYKYVIHRAKTYNAEPAPKFLH